MKYKLLLTFFINLIYFSARAQTIEGLARGVVKTQILTTTGQVVNDRLVYLENTGSSLVISSTDGTKNGTISLLSYNEALGLSPSLDKEGRFFSYVANTGSVLYFFIAEAGSSKRYHLWCTDGTKEGTNKLNFFVESEQAPFLSNNFITGGNLYYDKTEKNITTTYRISGESKKVEPIMENVFVFRAQFKNDNLVNLRYTVDQEGKRTYSNAIYIYNSQTESERELNIADIDMNMGISIPYADKQYMYMFVMIKNTRQLLEVNLANLQAKKLFETNKIDTQSKDGADNFTNFDKEDDHIFFQLSNFNYSSGASPTFKYEAWSIKGEKATKVADLPGVIADKVFYKGKWFFTAYTPTTNTTRAGRDLYSSDGFKGEVLASYPDSRQFVSELRTESVVPGFQVVDNKLFYFVKSANYAKSSNDYTIYFIDEVTLKPRVFMEDIRGFSTFHKLGNKLYFTDSEYIYESDGTTSGVKKVMTCPGFADWKFHTPTLNPSFIRNHITINGVYSVNGKILFNMTNGNFEHTLFSYLGNDVSKDAYGVADNRTNLWGFDPTATPFSCEGVIDLGAYGKCLGEPGVVAFLQYPDSQIEWYLNDKALGLSQGSDSLGLNESGKYKVKVSYKNCTSFSNEVNFTVDAPKVTLEDVYGQISIKVEEGYKRSNGTYEKFEIIYNNGVVYSENGVSRIPSFSPGVSKGLYTVKVTDSKGCIGESSIQMGEDNSDTPIANVSTDKPSPSASAITLFVNGGVGYTYQWQRNGVDIVGATSKEYVAKESGNYTVKVTVNGKTVVSQVLYITITGGDNNNTPTATISSSTTSAYAPQTLTLTANTGTGYSYQWKKDGVNIAGATNSTYEAAQSGSYTVTITANGQTATSAAISIMINIPLAVEPEIFGIQLSVYPNPAEDYLTTKVSTVSNNPISMSLFTIDGRKVKTWEVSSSEQTYLQTIHIEEGWRGQQFLLQASTGQESVTKKIFIK